jgi:hypothetical protein
VNSNSEPIFAAFFHGKNFLKFPKNGPSTLALIDIVRYIFGDFFKRFLKGRF